MFGGLLQPLFLYPWISSVSFISRIPAMNHGEQQIEKTKEKRYASKQALWRGDSVRHGCVLRRELLWVSFSASPGASRMRFGGGDGRKNLLTAKTSFYGLPSAVYGYR